MEDELIVVIDEAPSTWLGRGQGRDDHVAETGVRSSLEGGKSEGGDEFSFISNRPPRGMCWTTTLFPRTSAYVKMLVIQLFTSTGTELRTAYILNKPEFTLPQLGTPTAME